MRKSWKIAVVGIPVVIVTALTTNIVSAPFDYLRNSLSPRPEIGSELRVFDTTELSANWRACGDSKCNRH